MCIRGMLVGKNRFYFILFLDTVRTYWYTVLISTNKTEKEKEKKRRLILITLRKLNHWASSQIISALIFSQSAISLYLSLPAIRLFALAFDRPVHRLSASIQTGLTNHWCSLCLFKSLLSYSISLMLFISLLWVIFGMSSWFDRNIFVIISSLLFNFIIYH